MYAIKSLDKFAFISPIKGIEEAKVGLILDNEENKKYEEKIKDRFMMLFKINIRNKNYWIYCKQELKAYRRTILVAVKKYFLREIPLYLDDEGKKRYKNDCNVMISYLCAFKDYENDGFRLLGCFKKNGVLRAIYVLKEKYDVFKKIKGVIIKTCMKEAIA